MKNVLMMSVAGLLVVAFSAPAFAGCFEDVEVSSYMVEVTPETPCLTFDVQGTNCVGAADMIVTNDCPEDLVVEFPRYDQSPYLQSIPANTVGYLQIERTGDTTVWQKTATLGTQTLTISVEYESRAYPHESCSAVGSAAIAPFTLLILLGLRRRQK